MEIKFNDVSYIYNENTPIAKQALKDININLEEGKVYGIIGPSGSGKTTIANLINALILPTSGTINVGHFVLKKNNKINDINKLRFDVGLVFQFPEEQFFESTVRKELEFGMKYFDYKTSDIKNRISEALFMVGLDDTYLDLNPFNLSSGEKRRIAIASILVFNPKVLILDEPTIELDKNGKKMLISLIKKLKERYNRTIIVCTNDTDMVYELVDNIIVLDAGEVIIEGDKYEVFKHISLLKNHHISVPQIVTFTYKVINNKGVKLGRHIDIKDLIKDIYRNV